MNPSGLDWQTGEAMPLLDVTADLIALLNVGNGVDFLALRLVTIKESDRTYFLLAVAVLKEAGTSSFHWLRCQQTRHCVVSSPLLCLCTASSP